MLFLPTGGINLQNLMTYLSFPRVIACGGSWMVEADLIAAGNFTQIKKLAQEAVAAIKEKFI
jgi:2-dehydro-3-deoxyphosphogluconate aldolase/(4S)-4-hydroxy-2-oxoglutarate aldolase